MQFDPLSDAFVRIYNAEQAGHYEVSINPASKLLESMLTIMQSSGYVGEFERIADGRGDAFRVELCLLYTSPSPRDMSASRMPSSA